MWQALAAVAWIALMLAAFVGCLLEWPPPRDGEPMVEGQQVDYGFLGLLLTLLALYVARGMME